MLKSYLCDFNDTYMLVSGTITVVGAGGEMQQKQETEIKNKQYLEIMDRLPTA